MVDFALRFNDFSGGDWGIADASRQRSNMWSGRNVQLYRNGLLGPRLAPRVFTVTGLPVAPVAPGPVGFTMYGNKLIVCLDKLYGLTQPSGAPGSATDAVTLVDTYAAYPAVPSAWVDFATADGILFSVAGGVLYRHPGTATTAVTTPAQFSQITRWGYFLVGVDKNVPWRLWFSSVTPSGPDFTVWPSTNFLDIGNGEPITALLPIFNTLYVGKPSGWWSVTGVLGEDNFVREISSGNGPLDPRMAAVTTDNRLAYYPLEPAPTTFNGVSTYIAGDHSSRSVTSLPAQSVIATPTLQQVVYAVDRVGDDTKMLLWDVRRNAYERHAFAFNTPAGVAPTDIKDAYGCAPGVMWMATRATAVGQTVQIMSWRHDTTRARRYPDDLHSGSEETDVALQGQVTLPSWYDGQGRQVMLRELIIQFRKWTGPDTTSVNKMTVRVQALGNYQSGDRWSEPQRWEEPMQRATLDGLNDSWRVGIGDQGWGNGFAINFREMSGIALSEVVCLVEVRSAR